MKNPVCKWPYVCLSGLVEGGERDWLKERERLCFTLNYSELMNSTFSVYTQRKNITARLISTQLYSWWTVCMLILCAFCKITEEETSTVWIWMFMNDVCSWCWWSILCFIDFTLCPSLTHPHPTHPKFICTIYRNCVIALTYRALFCWFIVQCKRFSRERWYLQCRVIVSIFTLILLLPTHLTTQCVTQHQLMTDTHLAVYVSVSCFL